jgi:CRISPR-associated endonuclease/helicase Cas3
MQSHFANDVIETNCAAYAHTLAGEPPAKWELLGRHLAEVGGLAGEFANAFGARAWGEALGYWHDLGKYSNAFQEYLLRNADPDASEPSVAGGRVDHSTFGAQYAAKTIGGHRGRVMAFCIAGHHGGLPDARSSDASTERSSLQWRLRAGPPRVPAVELPLTVWSAPELGLPFGPTGANAAFQVAFFARMLFSCLIDADRTATEAFCDPAKGAERRVARPTIGELASVLGGFLHAKSAAAPRTTVNEMRQRVLGDCLAAAPEAPGFFSLNVPTGGGKTYSSLAFALNHAHTHDLRRVVVAIPFTSIIEQTADVYREAIALLAGRALVEHHSGLNPRQNTRANEMAAENWDAPLIVTTNVQLFESLFAAATTPCRKLHRLARSVIILDEAQMLPVELLAPTLAALRELVVHYGCTVVLCTATQPALERRDGFDLGIEGVRHIVRDPASLFAALKRVTVRRVGLLADDELADRLAGERTALCIVNSRAHAAGLFRKISERTGGDATYHLSTYMCAEHRTSMLRVVRERLKNGMPCRLVSTQLVEAGVDIDFPVVFRAPTGFDGAAQAAGRCNREGALAMGSVYLFDTASRPPPGLLRDAAQTAHELAKLYPDPLTPDAINAYFRLFYWSQSHKWDKHAVLPQFDADLSRPDGLDFRFRAAAERYQLIRDDQTPILVPYDDVGRSVRDRMLRGEPMNLDLLRTSQRYLVSVWERLLTQLLDAGVLIAHESGMFLLVNDAAYTDDTGLNPDVAGIDPAVLVQ